jgi:hypothetical protein
VDEPDDLGPVQATEQQRDQPAREQGTQDEAEFGAFHAGRE